MLCFALARLKRYSFTVVELHLPRLLVVGSTVDVVEPDDGDDEADKHKSKLVKSLPSTLDVPYRSIHYINTSQRYLLSNATFSATAQTTASPTERCTCQGPTSLEKRKTQRIRLYNETSS